MKKIREKFNFQIEKFNVMMKEKLKWNAVGLVKKVKMLKTYFEAEKTKLPEGHTKKI